MRTWVKGRLLGAEEEWRTARRYAPGWRETGSLGSVLTDAEAVPRNAV